MMTLDEAIRHCEEVAKSCQLKAYDIERDDYKDLEECAAEHRQLAEWLKELKERRKQGLQPTCNQLAKDTNVHCKDTISRQAAIDALDGEIEVTGRTNAEAVKGYVRLVRDRLERLPSAHPEPIRINIDHALTEEEYEKLKQKIADAPIVLMPSAQPEPCEDAVSRRKAFEYFVSLWECIGTIMDREEWEDVCKTTANELPSVTPKRRPGKWVNNLHDLPVCDQCGYMTPYDRAIDDYEYGNYCPNCGAVMSESLKMKEMGECVLRGIKEGIKDV